LKRTRSVLESFISATNAVDKVKKMSKIKAIVTEPEGAARLVLREVDPPEPLPNQALVRVEAISLNRGEVMRALNADKPYVPGWDLAGRIEQAAADGSGPKAGARVVGLLGSGAWTELAAVPASSLAELPTGVDMETASTLPVAGLTALVAVEKSGSLLGRKALVTGASGGVGDFAVQLARLAGADVVGAVRQPEHADFVR
jgi:NADPH:quinone reductase-like Zn-dependent oxidoreductase